VSASSNSSTLSWGLDVALTLAHVAVVLALLLLWIPERARRWHLLLVGATALSWFGLGLVHGLGYCFLTDWQWQVKRWRGETDLPGSFIHYALTRWFGLPLREVASDVITGLAFALVSGLSLALTARDRSRHRASSTPSPSARQPSGPRRKRTSSGGRGRPSSVESSNTRLPRP